MHFSLSLVFLRPPPRSMSILFFFSPKEEVQVGVRIRWPCRGRKECFYFWQDKGGRYESSKTCDGESRWDKCRRCDSAAATLQLRTRPRYKTTGPLEDEHTTDGARQRTAARRTTLNPCYHGRTRTCVNVVPDVSTASTRAEGSGG